MASARLCLSMRFFLRYIVWLICLAVGWLSRGNSKTWKAFGCTIKKNRCWSLCNCCFIFTIVYGARARAVWFDLLFFLARKLLLIFTIIYLSAFSTFISQVPTGYVLTVKNRMKLSYLLLLREINETWAIKTDNPIFF